MTTSANRAYLLGPYPGNTHISINNYFDYCRTSLQKYLSGWEFDALKPGQFHDGAFLKADVGRKQAWKELYFDWPMRLRKLDAAVFHIVDQGMAWYRIFLSRRPAAGKTIVTVHDLINVLNMRGKIAIETLPKRRQHMVKVCMAQIQKSDAVICPSSATASDVARELQIPCNRIHVIHNSIPSVFRPMPETNRIETRKRLFGDVAHVILHVGKPTAYKNRIGVLKSFELIHASLPDSKLVLTSQALTEEETVFLKGRACGKAIEVHQPAHQEDLRELLCAADVFMFPSITEGFGWPPVEAMSCGCPVVSSVGGSLNEVVGDGAVRVKNPMDAQCFAAEAITILKDRNAAHQWRERGFANAQRFSEETLGPQLASLYSSLG